MPIVTIVIIVATCAVSYTCFQQHRLIDDLVFSPPAVEKGEYWRLMTHGFVHADAQHLLFNMITLFFFGRAIEPFFAAQIGLAGYGLFYLGGIVIAMLPSWLQHRNDNRYQSLGASGAVSAVLFTYILIAPWSTIYVFILPVPAIVFAALYIGYSIYAAEHSPGNINHSAHLWGAAYGIIFTLFMEPRLWGHFISRLTAPLSGI